MPTLPGVDGTDAPPEPILVIDFGTTTTAAAIAIAGQASVIIREPASGSSTWPSTVCLRDGTVLVGSLAEDAKREDPSAYRDEIKRDLGSTHPIQLGPDGPPFRPEELVAAILAAVRGRAEQMTGAVIVRAVLTVPASYGPHDRDPRTAAMITAGELAGLAEVDLLSEPVAAAHSTVAGKPFAAGDVVLVIDYGGGTLDTAAVRIADGGVHDVLGYAALDDCGGRDIDARLHRHLLAVGGTELTEHLTPEPDDPGSALESQHVRMDLDDFVRRTKHHLSSATTAPDYFRPTRTRLPLGRDELAAIAAPEIERAIDCCRTMLGNAKIEADQLVAVLALGGTTRTPVVVEALAAAFGRPPRHAEEPDLAVVHGAAKWAARRSALGGAESPWLLDTGQITLRWHVPGEVGTVLRWHAEPGDHVEANAVLLTARTARGALVRLAAPDRPSTLLSTQVRVGEPIYTGLVAGVAGSLWITPYYRWRHDPPNSVDRIGRAIPSRISKPGVLTFSPDDTLLAIAYEGVLEIFDLATEWSVNSILAEVTERKIRRLRFAADGRHVVAMDSDGVAHLVTADGKAIASFGGETWGGSDIDIDPLGAHVCSFAGNLEVRELGDPDRSVLAIDALQARAGAFAADGRSIVALTDHDDTYRLIRVDAVSGQRVQEVPIPDVSSSFATLRRDPASTGYLLSDTDGIRTLSHDLRIESFVKDYDPGGLAIEADRHGRYFVLSGNDLRIFDRQTRRLTQRLTVDSRPHRAVDAAALSSDGRILAVSGSHDIRIIPLDDAVTFAPGLTPITLAGANDDIDPRGGQEHHGAR